MRIWSLHPAYLDTRGLVALWRETLLAKHVLEGKTSGYKNHPQLIRFRSANKPLDSIHFYLQAVWTEAEKRNFSFDRKKFAEVHEIEQLTVSVGQIDFEKGHLLNKLKIRDKQKYSEIAGLHKLDTHPLFYTIEGDIEAWERR